MLRPALSLNPVHPFNKYVTIIFSRIFLFRLNIFIVFSIRSSLIISVLLFSHLSYLLLLLLL